MSTNYTSAASASATDLSLFERATRLKIRFETTIGVLTTEDLFDLPLTSAGNRPNLDMIARQVNRQLKDSTEESFVDAPSTANTLLTLKLDVVKRVIEVRLAERDLVAKRSNDKMRREQLLELIAKKQDSALEAKTIEELQAELAAIG